MPNKSRKLIRAALMSALCLLLTRVVTIPVPTGYVNLGDCAVLMSAWLLGPWYGGMAAGTGTMLADLLSGYVLYAPATFLIKFLMAAAASVLFDLAKRRKNTLFKLVGAVAAEAIMAAGYFVYESTFLKLGAAAAASVPANLLQGVVGAITGLFAISALDKHIDRWT